MYFVKRKWVQFWSKNSQKPNNTQSSIKIVPNQAAAGKNTIKRTKNTWEQNKQVTKNNYGKQPNQINGKTNICVCFSWLKIWFCSPLACQNVKPSHLNRKMATLILLSIYNNELNSKNHSKTSVFEGLFEIDFDGAESAEDKGFVLLFF